MKQYLFGKIFIGILFFCCILFYTGGGMKAAADCYEAEIQMGRTEGGCLQEDDDLSLDWRYVRIYIDEESYLVVNIMIVLIILLFLAVFAIVRERWK